MPKPTAKSTEDGEFSPAIRNSRNLCIVGNLLLTVLSLATLIIAVLSYIQAPEKRPEELAQCIVVRQPHGTKNVTVACRADACLDRRLRTPRRAVRLPSLLPQARARRDAQADVRRHDHHALRASRASHPPCPLFTPSMLRESPADGAAQPRFRRRLLAAAARPGGVEGRDDCSDGFARPQHPERVCNSLPGSERALECLSDCALVWSGSSCFTSIVR